MPTPETINLFVLIITLIFLVLTLKNNVYGLLAYTCISMTRPGLLYPFLGQIRFEMLVAIVILAIMLFSKECKEAISFSRSKNILNMFIFFVVIVCSMIQSIDFPTAYDQAWEFAKVYAFFLMIIALIRTEKDLKMFLWTFSFLMVWMGYEPIFNYLSGVTTLRGDMEYGIASTGRAAGHVALGIYLCQGLAFIWYLSASSKSKITWIIGTLCMFLSITGVLVSGSRGALVGIIILILLIAYYSRRRFLYFSIGAVVIFAGIVVMGSGYQEQMGTILEFGQSDLSAQSRFVGLRHGLEMLVKRPILGVGPGCYPVARSLWFGWGLWAHNVYGQLAGDLGLIGILAWARLVYTYLRSSYLLQKKTEDGSLLLNSVTAVIVSNGVCFVLGFFAHTLYGYFWYMSAAIVIVASDLHESRLLRA